MKYALLLASSWFWLGCSAAAPDEGHPGPAGAAAGVSAGGNAAGTGGMVNSSGGAAGDAATSGGSAGGASGGVGGSQAGTGGSAGSAGAGGGAGASNGDCTINPAGALKIVDDVVHDETTCVDWMRTTKTGVNYAAAETFCGDSMLGGFDDWRIPSADELASIVTKCGKYPPEGPIDTTVFDLQGDGYWTTTSAGEPNKVCAIGMLNAGGYYHYGTAGPQVVRCARGKGAVQAVTDCITAQGCMNW